MKCHLEFTRLLILNLHNNHSNLVGVKFEISTNAIFEAAGIPAVEEKWFKNGKLDKDSLEPFIKPRYRGGSKISFPFSHLRHKFKELMFVIMKYFTCEGRYSRLYDYHVRLLMHFTRVLAI